MFTVIHIVCVCTVGARLVFVFDLLVYQTDYSSSMSKKGQLTTPWFTLNYNKQNKMWRWMVLKVKPCRHPSYFVGLRNVRKLLEVSRSPSVILTRSYFKTLFGHILVFTWSLNKHIFQTMTIFSRIDRVLGCDPTRCLDCCLGEPWVRSDFDQSHG